MVVSCKENGLILSSRVNGRESGAALVEFALVALVLYLLVAGGVELGRMIFAAQVLQDAARIAARELSLTPFDPALVDTFEQALADPGVLTRIYNPNLLVINLDCGALNVTADDLDNYFGSMPLVNRALRPIFISETATVDGTRRRLLRYPGALLKVNPPPPQTCPPDTNTPTPTGFVVGIPRVASRDPSTGVETIDWVDILAEVRHDPASGPFSFNSDQHGVVAVMINYPFQSAALTAFRPNAAGPLEPNISNAIPAEDGSVGGTATTAPAGTNFADPVYDAVVAPYSGKYGLGSQYAFAGTVGSTGTVRPYRSLLSGQAIFRREVIQ
jgi:hypothetical protein